MMWESANAMISETMTIMYSKNVIEIPRKPLPYRSRNGPNSEYSRCQSPASNGHLRFSPQTAPWAKRRRMVCVHVRKTAFRERKRLLCMLYDFLNMTGSTIESANSGQYC
jgi:hypothetical protein